MDLKNFVPQSETITVELLSPMAPYEVIKNPDGSPMTIELYATHSKFYRSEMHEQTNKRIKQMSKKRNTSTDITAQELESAGINLLAKMTKSWNITYGDEVPKLTVEKAEEIYTEVFWIRSQLEEALSEDLGFTNS